jgi:hypothetical protein
MQPSPDLLALAVCPLLSTVSKFMHSMSPPIQHGVIQLISICPAGEIASTLASRVSCVAADL